MLQSENIYVHFKLLAISLLLTLALDNRFSAKRKMSYMWLREKGMGVLRVLKRFHIRSHSRAKRQRFAACPDRRSSRWWNS